MYYKQIGNEINLWFVVGTSSIINAITVRNCVCVFDIYMYKEFILITNCTFLVLGCMHIIHTIVYEL